MIKYGSVYLFCFGGAAMRLEELIRPLLLHTVTGDLLTNIKGIQTDSRCVKSGDLFIAVRGFTVDGHRFVNKAVENGAVAVLVEELVAVDVPVVLVPDSRRAMAVVAATFFRHPTQALKLIGITGTNGKTTTAHLIQQVLAGGGGPVGIIGTLGMEIGDRTYPLHNTTPDVLELQRGFRMMCDQACQYAVIEVSSHALEMGRTRGCQFRLAVFTNLTQDHLDYHETMEKYKAAKGLLFSQLGNQYGDRLAEHAVAILNADEEASLDFAKSTSAQVITYGIEQRADVRARELRFTTTGTAFVLDTFKGTMEMQLQLMGKFNVYNALAAISVALVEGVSLEEIKQRLEAVMGINGRFEPVDAGQPFTVIVDYAHTPDGLENVLTTIREFARGNVVTVVGCGGDRDRSKRPLMAQIAAKYSDLVVLTADNPRTEDPASILVDMLEGMRAIEPHRYVTLLDRKEAIYFALRQAAPNDLVLIAGKGHETYQEVNGVRMEFDDREVVRAAICEQYLNEG
jgi:UDP-N-acetylmuramoyl-L-alanyl-D-glutamate--2,6-diaminopimelate ligase